MEQFDEKIYFKPGDLVKSKLPNSPVMLVLRKEIALFKDNQSLKRIKCRWFTATGELQEAVFNTKDLVLTNSNGEIGQ